jgi:hypothetical protein
MNKWAVAFGFGMKWGRRRGLERGGSSTRGIDGEEIA